MSQTTKAIIVDRKSETETTISMVDRPVPELADGEVLVRVAYSSLNYKDAMAVTCNPGVVKTLPLVPGIDLAGEVVESRSRQFGVGDRVLATGYELGVARSGGYQTFAIVPADWLIAMPDGLDTRTAMLYGTAGLTAALSTQALLHGGVEPSQGPIVVTGASGGVGSIAVGMLSHLGFDVTAVSGKPGAHDLLRSLGAKEILPREAMVDHSMRPLLTGRWAGAVDTVGGATLANVLRGCKPYAVVAACGLVGGPELHMTVMPFILRGVTLAGITTVDTPMHRRLLLWPKMASEWRPHNLDAIATEIQLGEVPHWVPKILAGQTTGRVIVRVG